MFKFKESISLNRLKKDSKIVMLAMVISISCSLLFVSTNTTISENTSSFENESHLNIISWLIIFLKTAFIEETIFRIFPFILALVIIKILSLLLPKYYNKIFLIITMIFGILSSIVFGLMHGNILNIFVQGVMGFSFWMVVKQNYQLTNSLITSGFKAVLWHLIYNFILFLPILLIS